MLEKQIIDWINSDRDYHAGIYLLKQLYPTDPLIGTIESPESKKAVFRKLGKALRTNNIPRAKVVTLTAMDIEKGVKEQGTPAVSNTETVEEDNPDQPADTKLTGLSDAQRLAIEAGHFREARRKDHSRLHQSRTDSQRKAIMVEIDKATDAIKYRNKLISQIKKGEIEKAPELQNDTGNDFGIPENIEELSRHEITLLRQRLASTRSKRLTKMNKLAAEGKQDSPEHKQAAADHEQLQITIEALDEHRKVR